MAAAVWLARDLTNTPSSVKNPAWFAKQVVAEAAGCPGLTVTVREPARLEAEGFGGILAVGGGSATPPRLVELSWQPAGAGRHVVLIGKGITFDTGGISIKTRDGMKLMRKDMAGGSSSATVRRVGRTWDMSAPSWIESSELDLTKGATGWGIRTLVRYLSA